MPVTGPDVLSYDPGIMRRRLLIASAALLVGACSLFTDLGGFEEKSPDVAAVDASDATAPAVDTGSDARVEDAFVTPDAARDACPTADPAEGLVAFYPFDEGQGATITDCSPSQLHGSLIGSPAAVKWVPGHSAVSGTAVDLDGVGGCFDIGTAPTLDFATKTFTIAAWLKIRVFYTGGSTARYVFARETSSGALRGWHFGSDDPSSVELDVIPPDAAAHEIAHQVVANEWMHITAVYDGAASSSLKLYVNGLLSDTDVGPYALAPAPLGIARLGCKAPGERVFDGVIDDLRIYARRLTDAEITKIATP